MECGIIVRGGVEMPTKYVQGMTDGQFKAYIRSLLDVLENESDADKAKERLIKLLQAALEE